MTSDKDFFSSDSVKKIKKTDECTIYQMKNTTGQGLITQYEVVAGIEFMYMDIHMETILLQHQPSAEVIEISHCREGNVEWKFKNGSYLYCQEGDMQITGKVQHPIGLSFPINHYHGIVISIYVDEVKKTLATILDGYFVDLEELHKKFCSGRIPFISHVKDSIEHIFSDLYHVPENIRKSYFKIKVLELLLLLTEVDIGERNQERDYFSKIQVEKVKAIKNYITDNMNQQFTLNHLSLTFDISPAFLKRCFHGVYGMSVDSYIRSYRMQAAASMLRKNRENITTIAGKVGYNNPSKFSAAFKKVMGVTPKNYQKSYMI